MKSPRDDKRAVILAAATRAIADQGLSVPTALIAREAGVANGSLFNVFPTKVELFNELFVELKRDVIARMADGLPASAGSREQAFHLWKRWTEWGVRHPEKRRAFAQLSVSDLVSAGSRGIVREESAGILAIIRGCGANGALRDRPDFVVGIMENLVDATIQAMADNPGEAGEYCTDGFGAFWRAIA